ncbi:MAG: alanyl-tRNA synthetase [Acidimicrobiaceae bacterium]|nr:alanyl-tRNA synthetase [Acidimicrobiaceae bacterium]
MPMTGDQLRRLWTKFFVDRDHSPVPSAGLIPHHPRAPMFTNAGMNQFLPYILGEEQAAHARATSVQKCVRIKGKHDDIENIGRSPYHFTFFEMLGNFSFGDYFKEGAIPLAWELSTEVLGYDGDRIWATVFLDDDDAFEIWRDVVGLPAERIQRMGDDNFWQMGDTGPCGPCSELFYDVGPERGAEGGPAHGGEDRYLEFWNLVFMQFDRQPDGSMPPLPRKIIDTGAGFERNLLLLNGLDSVFETDMLRPIVAAAERATNKRYGESEPVDIALRILADHARSISFLISDGVFPSNEERGYVLRRIIRRAVRQAYMLGVDKNVTPALVDGTVEVMGEAYPDLARNADFVKGVVEREEDSFRRTLKSGMARLDEELERSPTRIGGPVAFQLHDTFGFPIELTRELAAERGAAVDEEGFAAAMEEQRRRAKESAKGQAHTDAEDYRQVLEQFGTTEFTGYTEYETKARILKVVPRDDEAVEVFLDRTPFYAEGGGQVGDTGTITSETGVGRVHDTTYALPGLHRHVVQMVDGELHEGQEVTAAIDAERRNAIRRNHTGTHLLHWALREVLGGHVKQQGSLVSPEYLRFDFSHHSPVSPEDMEQIESLVNGRILDNEPVRAYTTSKEHAEQLGAIAFFGDKYGDFVRVVEAGDRSMELCGGTHVGALGMIGPVKVTSEGSIGANMRRIFALTGTGTLERVKQDERILERAADLLRTQPEELPEALERALARQRELEQEVKALRSHQVKDAARALRPGPVIVARQDGFDQDQLKDMAVFARDEHKPNAVVLIGTPDGERVVVVAAVAKDSGLEAGKLAGEAGRVVGGGGGGKGDVAVAGGKDPSKIDEALEAMRARLSS